tara:strand:+ start:530 stop:724 length:195 start_codon:yes stop_codon:yes gene_type:complete
LNIFTKYSIDEIKLLRTVVKNVHLKHYPKDKKTDKEADRILETITPETLEKLHKLAVDYGITNL